MTSVVLGLSSSPPDEPAMAKKRLGHVGPGSEENHASQMANSRASVVSTGSLSGEKQLIARSALVPPLARYWAT